MNGVAMPGLWADARIQFRCGISRILLGRSSGTGSSGVCTEEEGAMRSLCLSIVLAFLVNVAGCGSIARDSKEMGEDGPTAHGRQAAPEGQAENRHGSWINEHDLRALIDDQRGLIWKNLFVSQCHANPWPSALSDSFHENIVSLCRESELPAECLDEYQGFACDHASKLATLVDSVEWNENTYARIQSRFTWHERPSTIQVRLAQEDLWCYEAILRSIARTNRDLQDPKNTSVTVRRIETLEVGQPAARAFVSARKRIAYRQYFGRHYPWEGWGAESVTGDAQSATSTGGIKKGTTATESTACTLLNGRYVDLTGNPLTADSRPYPAFNLLPVHIIVDVEQEYVARFLDRLSWSPMPMDVKYVNENWGAENITPDTPIVILPQGQGRDSRIRVLGFIRIFNPPKTNGPPRPAGETYTP